jgi:hypothetical protein
MKAQPFLNHNLKSVPLALTADMLFAKVKARSATSNMLAAKVLTIREIRSVRAGQFSLAAPSPEVREIGAIRWQGCYRQAKLDS